MTNRLAAKSLAGICLFLAGSTGCWASSFTITPTFDSTITSLPNAATVETAINTVIGVYESTFTNPITLNITFSSTGSGLGSSSYNQYAVTYSNFLSALTANATSTNAQLALQYLPNAVNNPVTNEQYMLIKPANAAALGIDLGLGAGTSDGTVSINLSQTTTGNGHTTGSYSLTSVVEHEINEILGLGSDLDLSEGSNAAYVSYIAPEDLFRYSSSGARSYTTAAVNAFFSINGTSDVAQFNNPNETSCKTNSACGDYGDWASGTGKVQVQDATGTPGGTPTLTSDGGAEVEALNVIGYNVAITGSSSQSGAPEPSTWLLLGTGLVAVASFRLKSASRIR